MVLFVPHEDKVHRARSVCCVPPLFRPVTRRHQSRDMWVSLDVRVAFLLVSRFLQIVLPRSERDRGALLPLNRFVHNPHSELRR